MRVVGKVGAIGAVAAAVLVMAGCGSGDDSEADTTTTAKATTSAAAQPQSAAQTQSKGRECTADDIKVDGAFGKAPTITIPDDCDAPKTLITKDLTPGSGPGAQAGQKLTMNYSLITWSDKKKLDSSFDRGEPFTLTLGAGEVIKGWDQGLVGVQQGARRLLIVPPDLGYGAGGRGMKPYETLVFVTDAVKVG
ncbi:FKBP-type peptidyl-prolyl cis-trans isomerase [Nocardia sp. NBC_01503]|uniref:FKBP-type peptidyl-prolyl cis-trans isomerase n=1 Tax=Nocardia sp. NBC_01503 TaxID=2975997 RepID=UPI002E7AC6AE|nr:FKBP-type peptidyl-prolyl cis-trans isomerase [Nocardia sp. NBC_01503]WTL33204.1 FKBP-type peptidyl-prolyl cis-trans isomerase [Nocardia sp. NBC_01503]